MITVQLSTGFGLKELLTLRAGFSAEEIHAFIVKETGLPKERFYLVHNGRLALKQDICSTGYLTAVPRLLGGKGGFGSMLRAIGAQIEKTTNREACRDLSGRRLRDINEEKRLKAWIEKQSKREKEAAERKKKKLERLCAEPRHEFKDQNYERERSILTERVGDAIEQGFKLTVSSGEKRKSEEPPKVSGRKKTHLLALDIDSDELDSDTDEDSANDGPERKKMRTSVQQDPSNGEQSSEEDRPPKETECIDISNIEASTDKQSSDTSRQDLLLG